MLSLIRFVLIFLPTCSTAQSLTLQTGISHSYMPIHTDDKHGTLNTTFKAPAIRYAFGVSLNLGKNPLVHYSADVQVYRGGGKVSDAEKTGPLPWGQKYGQVRMDYIAIGGSVHFSPLNGKTSIEMEAGPRINYMYHGQESEELYYWNKYKQLTRLNFGMNAGFGVYHQLPKIKIGVRGIYIQNLKKVIDQDEWVAPVVPAKATERTFLIQFCSEIPLKSTKS